MGYLHPSPVIFMEKPKTVFIHIFSVMRQITRLDFRTKLVHILKYPFLIILLIASLIIIKDKITYIFWSSEGNTNNGIVSDSIEQEDTNIDSPCNVALIKLQWTIKSYIPSEDLEYEEPINDEVSAETVVDKIIEASEDQDIQAIILQIDSRWGSGIGGEEIMKALHNSPKYTVALVREAAASAWYYAAIWADKIVASKFSEIWSIGVTMSYLDYSKKNEMEGITYIPLSVWTFKDTWDPDKSITQKEKDLLMRNVQAVYAYFMQDVSNFRNIPLEKVKKIADGSTMLGQMALENKLIDEIGDKESVEKSLKEIVWQEIVVCEY